MVFRQCVLGGLVGILGIFVLFMLLVSPETLWYSMTFFFNPEKPGWTPQSGIAWRIEKGIPPYTAWVFAGLGATSAPIFALQAYMDSKSRAFFLLVWFYIFAYYLVWYISGVMATGTHDEVSVYTFGAMKGLSIATLYFHNKMVAWLGYDFFHERAWGLGTLPPILLGFTIAVTVKVLLYRLDRTKPLWFDASKPSPLLTVFLGIVLLLLVCYSVFVGMGSTYIVDRMSLVTGHIVPLFSVLMALLVLSQFLSSRILVVLLLAAFAFFATNNIRGSKQSFAPLKYGSNFIYSEFPFILDHVPFDSYAVYMKKWYTRENFDVAEAGYATFIYTLFFDKKHPYVPFAEEPRSREKCFIWKERDIPSGCESHDHVLTDDIDAVKKYFPKSELVAAFMTPKLANYYVLKIRGKG